MSHAHQSAGAGRTARVHLITVSTTRTSATDVAGPLLRDLVESAGHVVSGTSIVPDDAAAIGECLDGALGGGETDVVLLTGGTGVSARDCTPVVVRERLTRELPGFGELFRMLSFQEVGSAAMLSDAVGGLARSVVVFALPGSPKACRLAMERLILPELGHLLSEISKEAPPPGAARPTAPAARPAGGVATVLRPNAQRPTPPPQRPSPALDSAANPRRTMTIVEVVLLTIGATLDTTALAEAPEALSRHAGAMDVLNGAGQRASIRFEDGSQGLAFGYPDLQRPNAKVLVVRPGEPVAEIIAAHRGLQGVGVCAEGSPSGVLPATDERLAKVTQARCRGVAYEGPGTLFAVEADAVYLLDEGRVFRWDGRHKTPMGTVGQALGSLLLAWSQR